MLSTKLFADCVWFFVAGSRVGVCCAGFEPIGVVSVGLELTGLELAGLGSVGCRAFDWLAGCWQAISIKLEINRRRMWVMWSQSFRSQILGSKNLPVNPEDSRRKMARVNVFSGHQFNGWRYRWIVSESKVFSISIRVQHVSTEVAYVSVPVTVEVHLHPVQTPLG